MGTKWVKLDDVLTIAGTARFDININIDIDPDKPETVYAAAEKIAQQVCDAVSSDVYDRVLDLDTIETGFDIVNGEVVNQEPGAIVSGLTS